MDLQLTGSRVLVTGGTRGIGRAIVEAFAAEGAHVEFCARKPDEIAETEQALSSGPGAVHGSVVDVNYSAVVKARKSFLPPASSYGGLHDELRSRAAVLL